MGKMTERKPLEKWQRDDAKRLLALWETRSTPKLSQTDFGEQYEIGSQGAVWQYLHGRTPLNPTAAIRFARGLKCQVSDFSPTLADLLERGETGEHQLDAPAQEHPVPVVGTAQLGLDGYWYELEYPVGHGEGFVNYPTKDPNAYCVRVRGDSMRPRIKDGEFVVMTPNSAPIIGEEVFVQTNDGRSMIKIFDFKRSGVIQLSSINESFGKISINESDVAKLHYVSDILKPHRYYERNL